VTVIGVLVETEVGHENGLLAKIILKVAQCDLNNSIGVVSSAAPRIFGLRNSEKDEPAHTGFDRLIRRSSQLIAGVLNNAGHGFDRRRLRDSLFHKERQDQIRGMDAGLTNEAAQCRSAPPTPRPLCDPG